MSAPARPVTVITGAGRGIGAAIALRLADAGHDLALNFHHDHAAAERSLEAVLSKGGRAITVRADVGVDAEVDWLFRETEQELGRISGLVNNAGMIAQAGDLADTPPEVIRRGIEVNLTAVVLCSRLAVRSMSTRRGGAGGAIVNISSAAATIGSAHEYVYYAAAKAGVDAFTAGLAKEVGPDGVRVNAVAPGTVRTDLHAAAGNAGRPDRIAAQAPLRRTGEPAEIAAAVEWLLGPEASYVTGAVLRVAGGL
ncbi:MAG TPA: SDR family oxidoreductase [Mycobacteriales bacterium]|nr:SDR family oxidoreductase [Mycobacteriales bacterium]